MTKTELHWSLIVSGRISPRVTLVVKLACGSRPEGWPDCSAEREAIVAIEASHPYVPAIREAFKDVVRAAR